MKGMVTICLWRSNNLFVAGTIKKTIVTHIRKLLIIVMVFSGAEI